MTRHARATDPRTSWAATYTKHGEDTTLRAVIWSALHNFGPLSHDQIIDAVRSVRSASESGIRTRTRELVVLGLVEQVPDMHAKSRYGRVSLLWQVVR